MSQPRILIVNHSSDFALLLKLAVQDAFPNAVVLEATDRAEAERRFQANPPDVILLAIGDSLAEARQFVQAVRGSQSRTARLILMGNRPDMEPVANELAAAAWVRRPARRAELESALRGALEEVGLSTQREDVAPPERAKRHTQAERREH